TIAGLGYYKIDSLMSALDKTLMIIILGYLCWISTYQHDFDLYMLIYGQSISYFLAILISGVFLVRKIGWVIAKFDGAKIIQVIKDSSPFVLILILMTAYNKLDGVMLGRLLDDDHYQAGVYASAYRFYEAANMVGYLFAALLLPMFAANMKNHTMLSELKSIGLRFVVLSSMLIVWSIFFYGEYFLKLLYDGYESGYLYTLYFLIFSYLMVAIAYIYGTLIVASGQVRNFNILLGIGLMVNIIFNLILIPIHFAIGAAVATLITQTFVTIGQIWLVKKDLNITISRFDLQRALLFCISSGMVFYLTSHLYSLPWTINLTVSILICLLLSFILKIVNKEEVVSLLKRKI
ncbi:MAG: polysaccharide biosynthesis C-terminal domain-containing protein, partial [Saprospiraceae bacterium]